jgi:hypothetical protein
MCFDYEIIFLENRGILKEGWVIRALRAVGLEEQKRSFLVGV